MLRTSDRSLEMTISSAVEHCYGVLVSLNRRIDVLQVLKVILMICLFM